jgi:dihydropyrimidinase
MLADMTLDVTGRVCHPLRHRRSHPYGLPFGGTFSADDFETGSIAAAHGGTTTIVDFAVQYKGTSMRQALDTWLKKADGKAAIDYGMHMIITELPDDVMPQMDAMVKQEGVRRSNYLLPIRASSWQTMQRSSRR